MALAHAAYPRKLCFPIHFDGIRRAQEALQKTQKNVGPTQDGRLRTKTLLYKAHNMNFLKVKFVKTYKRCCYFSKVSISRIYIYIYIYIYTRGDFFWAVEKWFSMKSDEKTLGVSPFLKNAFGSTICLPNAYALPIYFFYMILMIFSCR